MRTSATHPPQTAPAQGQGRTRKSGRGARQDGDENGCCTHDDEKERLPQTRDSALIRRGVGCVAGWSHRRMRHFRKIPKILRGRLIITFVQLFASGGNSFYDVSKF